MKMPPRAPPRLDRVAFKTSRLLDFVGRRELTAQIGHGVEQWPLVVLKELVDNSLDAAEEAGRPPETTIRVTTDPGTISVADNGPGLAPETIVDILDYTVRVSSREAYCSPTRGAQGNALKTLLAMPFALDGAAGSTVIEAQGAAHRITFAVDHIRQEPKITRANGPSPVNTGTRVTLFWPDSASSILAVARPRFLQIADSYLWLNPHLGLIVEWDGERLIDVAASNPGWRKWLPGEPTSAHWYDAERLTRYMAAHVTRDQDLGRNRTVREFISEFRGLSGSLKQKRVIEESDATRTALANFLGDGQTALPAVQLLEAMQRHTRKIKPHDLGVIGRDHLLARCQLAGVNEKTFRYKSVIGEIAEGLPAVIETAFGWCPDAPPVRRIIAGANWSPGLGNPFRDFGRDGEGLERLLAEQRASAQEPIVFVVHLASPRVQFSDRGKTALILPGARQ
jgi:histidine kinase/DNA gyrase B/HSP90-like ATPase